MCAWFLPHFSFSPMVTITLIFKLKPSSYLCRTPVSASPLPWGHLHLTAEASLDKNDARSSKHLPRAKINCVMGLNSTTREREWGCLLNSGGGFSETKASETDDSCHHSSFYPRTHAVSAKHGHPIWKTVPLLEVENGLHFSTVNGWKCFFTNST